jgi:hypothetical protein
LTKRVAAIVQALGVAVLTAAGWTISETVGLSVAGIGLLAFGVALERSG